jgi:hypothetical protein
MKIHLWNDIKSEEQLSYVINQMKELGAPTIYYVSHDGLNYAMNGSHRLFAASILSIEPTFIKLEYDGETQGWWSTSMLATANGIYDDELHNEDCHYPNCHLLENVFRPHGQPFLYFLNQ